MLTSHILPSSCSHHAFIDTSVLPSNTATGVLTSPPAFITVLIAIAIGMLFIFFVGYSGIAILHITESHDVKDVLDSPTTQKITAGIGLSGFLLGARNSCCSLSFISINHELWLSGLLCWLIVRLWLAKAINDFNKSIVSPSKNANELVAAAGNGFISG